MKVVESRKKFYAASILVIVIGLVFMIVNSAQGNGAFNKDIEFTGGSLIQVDMNQKLDDSLRKDLIAITKEVTGNGTVSITSAGDTGVIITMPRTATEVREKLYEQIKEKYNLAEDSLQSDEDVSASISKDIKSGAIKAVLVGTILILLYISFRFKDYRFGMSAVLALVHDVLVMFAVYAVFRVPLNNSFIAAMLTIVGYSINDTIVVFDRIRENKTKVGLKDHDSASMDLVDQSVSQTVGRSINTSITTIVMVVLLFILGTDAVREFAFPLIIGVASGTYSSIFIASPLWYDFTHIHAKKHKQATSSKATSKKKLAKTTK